MQAEKKMELYKVPEVLIIQLKRFKDFNCYNDKNLIEVSFPIEDLDMTDYVVDKATIDDGMEIEVP